MQDSQKAMNGGTGKVTDARWRKMVADWGRMDKAERARAQQEFEELIQSMSLAHQEAYREYLRRLNSEQDSGKVGSR